MTRYIPSNEKERPANSITLYPARLLFKMEGEIRSFLDRGRLKKYISTKARLQDLIKGLFYEDEGNEWEKEEHRYKGKNGNK